jgi:hypothetical protein
MLWDSRGNVGVFGRLPTDRPHVVKWQAGLQGQFMVRFSF